MGNSTPEEAVRAWWEAMQAGDIPALARMTLDDYVSVGGPGGRALGRDALLAEATDFLTHAEIDDWTVDDVELRLHGDVAVCSYRWTERGAHGDTKFDIAGLATDVLVLRDGQWFHQAHHVSMR